MLVSSLIKIIAFFGGWMIIWLPIILPLAKLIGWYPGKDITVKQKLILLASLYLIAPLIVWFLIKIEGSSWLAFGLNGQPSILISLAVGFTLAIIGLGIVWTSESLLGLLDWQWQNSQRLLSLAIPILLVSLGVSFTEELVFRGVIFSELAMGDNYWLAAIISSIIFALLHLCWEQQETLPQLPGLWLMGIVLVAARLVDHGSLGLAWGLHSGWIWGLSCLDSAELVNYRDRSPSWIVGINQQPLAGLAGIGCLLATAASLWLLFQANF